MRMKKQNVQQSFRWMSGLLGEGRSSKMWVLKETEVCKNKIIGSGIKRKAVLFVTGKCFSRVLQLTTVVFRLLCVALDLVVPVIFK